MMVFEWIRNFIGNAFLFCFVVSVIIFIGELIAYRIRKGR